MSCLLTLLGIFPVLIKAYMCLTVLFEFNLVFLNAFQLKVHHLWNFLLLNWGKTFGYYHKNQRKRSSLSFTLLSRSKPCSKVFIFQLSFIQIRWIRNPLIRIVIWQKEEDSWYWFILYVWEHLDVIFFKTIDIHDFGAL